MPILNINKIKELDKYDKFLNLNNGNFMQNSGWGKVKKEDWKNEIITINDDDNIIMTANCLIRKFPFVNRSFIYVPRGPVGDIENIDNLKKMVKEIIKSTKQYKPTFIRFDPLIKANESMINNLKKNGFKVRNKYDYTELLYSKYNTMVFMENLTEEDIWQKISKNTKHKVNVAIKSGINVKFSNELKDLEKFYELYLEVGKRKGLSTRPFSYLKNMIESYPDDEIKIVLASKEDLVLAGSIIFINKNSVYYAYGATKIEHSELRASYLLHWRSIQYAKSLNCKTYDMGVVNNTDNSDGVYLFKHGFCRDEGVFEAIGEIDYVNNKFYYLLFTKFIVFIKKIVKKFFK